MNFFQQALESAKQNANQFLNELDDDEEDVNEENTEKSINLNDESFNTKSTDDGADHHVDVNNKSKETEKTSSEYSRDTINKFSSSVGISLRSGFSKINDALLKMTEEEEEEETKPSSVENAKDESASQPKSETSQNRKNPGGGLFGGVISQILDGQDEETPPNDTGDFDNDAIKERDLEINLLLEEKRALVDKIREYEANAHHHEADSETSLANAEELSRIQLENQQLRNELQQASNNAKILQEKIDRSTIEMDARLKIIAEDQAKQFEENQTLAIQNFTTQLQARDQQIESLQREKLDQVDSLADAKARQGQLEIQLRDAQENASEQVELIRLQLENELQDLRDSIEFTETENANITKKLESANTEISTLNQQLDALRHSHSEETDRHSIEHSEQINTELNEVRSELTVVKQELKESQRNSAELTAAIAVHSQTEAESTKRYDDLRAEYDAIVQSSHKLEKEILENEKETSMLREQAKMLPKYENEISGLHSKIDTLNAQHKQEIAKLTEEHQATAESVLDATGLSEQLESTTQQLEKLKSRVALLEDEKHQLGADLENAKRAQSAALKECHDAQSKLENMNLDSKADEIARLQEQLTLLEDSQEQTRTELECVAKSRDEVLEKFQQAQSQLENQQEICAESERKHADLLASLDASKASLEAVQSENSSISEELSRLQQDLEKAKAALQSAQADAVASREAGSMADEQLHQRCEALEEELSRSRAEMANLRDHIEALQQEKLTLGEDQKQALLQQEHNFNQERQALQKQIQDIESTLSQHVDELGAVRQAYESANHDRNKETVKIRQLEEEYEDKLRIFTAESASRDASANAAIQELRLANDHLTKQLESSKQQAESSYEARIQRLEEEYTENREQLLAERSSLDESLHKLKHQMAEAAAASTQHLANNNAEWQSKLESEKARLESEFHAKIAEAVSEAISLERERFQAESAQAEDGELAKYKRRAQTALKSSQTKLKQSEDEVKQLQNELNALRNELAQKETIAASNFAKPSQFEVVEPVQNISTSNNLELRKFEETIAELRESLANAEESSRKEALSSAAGMKALQEQLDAARRELEVREDASRNVANNNMDIQNELTNMMSRYNNMEAAFRDSQSSVVMLQREIESARTNNTALERRFQDQNANHQREMNALRQELEQQRSQEMPATSQDTLLEVRENDFDMESGRTRRSELAMRKKSSGVFNANDGRELTINDYFDIVHRHIKTATLRRQNVVIVGGYLLAIHLFMIMLLFRG